MSYTNTFIQVADDCPVTASVVPQAKGKSKPIHVIQYELLSARPYEYDHEELTFAVHVVRNGISAEVLAQERDALWADLFQKGHPCMRASSLTKRFGWGAHYNAAGKIAIYPMESAEYAGFVANEAGDTHLLMAMRSKRR